MLIWSDSRDLRSHLQPSGTCRLALAGSGRSFSITTGGQSGSTRWFPGPLPTGMTVGDGTCTVRGGPGQSVSEAIWVEGRTPQEDSLVVGRCERRCTCMDRRSRLRIIDKYYSRFMHRVKVKRGTILLSCRQQRVRYVRIVIKVCAVLLPPGKVHIRRPAPFLPDRTCEDSGWGARGRSCRFRLTGCLFEQKQTHLSIWLDCHAKAVVADTDHPSVPASKSADFIGDHAVTRDAVTEFTWRGCVMRDAVTELT